MINKNGQKKILDRLYDSKIGGILKIFTGDLQKIRTENLKEREGKMPTITEIMIVAYNGEFEKPSLESKTEYGSHGQFNDFRDHETINPSKIAQKKEYLKKNNGFLVYSPNFGI